MNSFCNVLFKPKGEFIKKENKRILTSHLLFPPSDRLRNSQHTCYIRSVCVYIYMYYIKYILYIHTTGLSSH